MIFAISKFIASLFGLDITKVQKAVILAVMVLAVVAIIALGLFLRSCFHKTLKLDEKAIQKAQTAIAEQDRKAMVEVLAESDASEAQIDANLANAKVEKLKAIHDAKQKIEAMSNDEIAVELERRLHE